MVIRRYFKSRSTRVIFDWRPPAWCRRGIVWETSISTKQRAGRRPRWREPVNSQRTAMWMPCRAHLEHRLTQVAVMSFRQYNLNGSPWSHRHQIGSFISQRRRGIFYLEVPPCIRPEVAKRAVNGFFGRRHPRPPEAWRPSHNPPGSSRRARSSIVPVPRKFYSADRACDGFPHGTGCHLPMIRPCRTP